MKKCMIALAAAALSAVTFAAVEGEEAPLCPTPLQLSLASPLQVMWGDRDVYGLKLDLIYGRSVKTYGLGLGVVDFTGGDFAGVAASAFNFVGVDGYGLQVGAFGNAVSGVFRGVQVNGFAAFNYDDFYGVQLGFLDFNTGTYGVQVGGLNWNTENSMGLVVGVANANRKLIEGMQIGAVNCAGSFTGCQLGVVNTTGDDKSYGLQLGVFNSAYELKGVQIGLINLNARGKLPTMVIANANF